MKISTKEMALVSLFTGLTAIGAFISIPLGPVPITMQTLFVLLGGVLLGAKLGALSQIVYIILGLVGVPIFAGFSGGLQTILKPSFGFLLGFIFAAYVVGKMTEDNPNVKPISTKKILVAAIAGTVVIYITGLPYMYFILNNIMNMGLSVGAVVKMGTLLFLPGDLLKIVIATFIGIRMLPIMKNRNY